MAKKMCPFLMMKHDEAFKCNCQEESCALWFAGKGIASEGKCSRLRTTEALHEIADHLKQIGMKICQP